MKSGIYWVRDRMQSSWEVARVEYFDSVPKADVYFIGEEEPDSFIGSEDVTHYYEIGEEITR